MTQELEHLVLCLEGAKEFFSESCVLGIQVASTEEALRLSRVMGSKRGWRAIDLEELPDGRLKQWFEYSLVWLRK